MPTPTRRWHALAVLAVAYLDGRPRRLDRERRAAFHQRTSSSRPPASSGWSAVRTRVRRLLLLGGRSGDLLAGRGFHWPGRPLRVLLLLSGFAVSPAMLIATRTLRRARSCRRGLRSSRLHRSGGIGARRGPRDTRRDRRQWSQRSLVVGGALTEFVGLADVVFFVDVPIALGALLIVRVVQAPHAELTGRLRRRRRGHRDRRADASGLRAHQGPHRRLVIPQRRWRLPRLRGAVCRPPSSSGALELSRSSTWDFRRRTLTART